MIYIFIHAQHERAEQIPSSLLLHLAPREGERREPHAPGAAQRPRQRPRPLPAERRSVQAQRAEVRGVARRQHRQQGLEAVVAEAEGRGRRGGGGGGAGAGLLLLGLASRPGAGAVAARGSGRGLIWVMVRCCAVVKREGKMHKRLTTIIDSPLAARWARGCRGGPSGRARAVGGGAGGSVSVV